MHHPFASGNWHDHKRCSQHCSAVLSVLTESNDERLKGKKQSSLGSFFFSRSATPLLDVPQSVAASSKTSVATPTE
eukprot:7388209-Ditylum_brightwellii.AAC.1